MASTYTPYTSRSSPPSSRQWKSRASGRSPPPLRLASPTSSRSPANTTRRPHAVIIYWEDVLAPTRWMSQHLGLGQSPQSIENAVRAVRASPHLQVAMSAIETRVLELVSQAVVVANGLPVCIMADATTAYVELVSALFFPRLTAALRSSATGVYVIGTPNTELDARELAVWKKNALHTLCLERVFSPETSVDRAKALLQQAGSGQLHVIALCGSTLDLGAVQRIREMAHYAVLKTAHVGTGADTSLDKFYDRLHAFAECLSAAAARTTAMTARV